MRVPEDFIMLFLQLPGRGGLVKLAAWLTRILTSVTWRDWRGSN